MMEKENHLSVNAHVLNHSVYQEKYMKVVSHCTHQEEAGVGPSQRQEAVKCTQTVQGGQILDREVMVKKGFTDMDDMIS